MFFTTIIIDDCMFHCGTDTITNTYKPNNEESAQH